MFVAGGGHAHKSTDLTCAGKKLCQMTSIVDTDMPNSFTVCRSNCVHLQVTQTHCHSEQAKQNEGSCVDELKKKCSQLRWSWQNICPFPQRCFWAAPVQKQLIEVISGHKQKDCAWYLPCCAGMLLSVRALFVGPCSSCSQRQCNV